MCETKKIVWRSRLGFHNNSVSLDWTITRVVPGLWAKKHNKFRWPWIILQSLTRKRFNGEERKPKVPRNLNKLWLLCSLLLLNQLLSADQKEHAVLIKSLKDPLRPMLVYNFSNKKAWMDSDIMKSISSRLHRKICLEKQKVVLFWDTATCYTETLQASLTNTKLAFLRQYHQEF